jgi:hypothetical protein
VDAAVKEKVGVLLVTRDPDMQRCVVNWAWLLGKAEEDGDRDTIVELLGEMVT